MVVLANGEMFDGEWMNDMPHGSGTLYKNEGSVVVGVWTAKPDMTRGWSSQVDSAIDAIARILRPEATMLIHWLLVAAGVGSC